MTSQGNRQGHSGLKAVVNDIRAQRHEGDSLALPLEVEERLWTYALGLLEPGEERQIFRLLVTNPRAEEILAGIRQAMVQAGIPNPIEDTEAVGAVVPSSVSQSVPVASIDRPGIGEVDVASWSTAVVQRVRETLAAMGKDLSFLAGIAVKLGDGLAKALEGPSLGEPAPALQPVLLGEEAAVSGVRKRVDFAGDGWQVSVIRISDQRLDLLVSTSPPAEGQVRLFQLRPEAGQVQDEDTDISARLVNGEALLRDCPDRGVFRIILPDDRRIVIALEVGNPGT